MPKMKAVNDSMMGVMRGNMEFSLRIHLLLLFPDVLLIIKIIDKGTLFNFKSNNKHVTWELIYVDICCVNRIASSRVSMEFNRI